LALTVGEILHAAWQPVEFLAPQWTRDFASVAENYSSGGGVELRIPIAGLFVALVTWLV
jgi:hypothetical protein